MNTSIENIQQLAQLYFDALYECDVDKLQKIFYPQAQYVCTTEMPLFIFSMPEYFAVVAQRISPASKKQKRRDKICSIQILSETTAVITLECMIEPKYFHDVLTLVYCEQQWRIISKVFSYTLLDVTD